MSNPSDAPAPDNQDEQVIEIPLTPKTKAYATIFIILVVVGGISAGRFTSQWAISRLTDAGILEDPERVRALIPISVTPETPRTTDTTFTLTEENSTLMTPANDPEQERWADAAGNFYSPDFISSFSYEPPTDRTPDASPQVRVQISPSGPTFKGRLEARNLKPNFAYQMKLRGSYDLDRDAFTIIGGFGRWRLPGRATNFTDQDFIEFTNKGQVEAYILFDYFVTDAEGNATRNFSLDASMHVLWNGSRQRLSTRLPESHVTPVTIDASNAKIYARPKAEPMTEFIWAERERIRYDVPGQIIRLLPTTYKAELVLTEESFHSVASDGGWWATVYAVPVEFEITP